MQKRDLFSYVWIGAILLSFAGVFTYAHFVPANNYEPLFGAPTVTYQRSLIPIDSTENVGTTSSPWDEGHFNEICLSADCKSAWPAGGAGSSAYEIATTSNIAVPELAYFTQTSGRTTLGSVATGTISSANSALTVTGDRYAVGGAAVFTVATTSTNLFTGTPGQILAFLNGGWTGAATTTFTSPLNYSAGAVSLDTSGSWTGNAGTATALAANGANCAAGEYPLGVNASGASESCTDATTEIDSAITTHAVNASAHHAPITLSGAVDYITLVGQDIVRGLIDLATDITGVLGIANGGLGAAYTDPDADQIMFWDDSQSKITSFTSLAGLTISNLALTVSDLICTDCINATEIEDIFLLNSGDAGTGVFDFGGATSFELPNGTGPTVDTTGEIAVDTTSGQLKYSYNGSTLGVKVPFYTTGFTFASTTQGNGTTTIYLAPAVAPITVVSAFCDSNRHMSVQLTDGSNKADHVMASSTVNSVGVQYTTNNTFTAGEPIRIDVGTSTNIASLVNVACRIKYTFNAD